MVISPGYFICSICSFLGSPLIFAFIILRYGWSDENEEETQENEEKDDEHKCCSLIAVGIGYILAVLIGLGPVIVMFYIVMPFGEMTIRTRALCGEDSMCICNIPVEFNDEEGFMKMIPFMKWTLQLGEAIPQVLIAITFYARHTEWIIENELLFEVRGIPITTTAVSIFTSCVSIVLGLLSTKKIVKNGIKIWFHEDQPSTLEANKSP